MKRFDMLSIAGIIVAIGAIAFGIHLEGGAASSLWELAALIIVVGGTLGAIMLQTPMHIFWRAIKMLQWTFVSPDESGQSFIQAIIRWSHLVRKEGVLGLERMAQRESDPFIKKALQLLVDGNEPATIRSIMEIDLVAREQRDLEAARVFEGMGGYSPTIGILGAVIGLIHVMNNLEDPARLGAGVATAFVATIYGVGFANLLFLPVAHRLRNLINHQSQIKELMLDGIVAIAEGENPRNIENRLRGYFDK